MRKLVPPNQRIALKPMSSVEVLRYRPDPTESSIKDTLAAITIKIPFKGIQRAKVTEANNQSKVETESSITLLDFLTRSPFSHGSAEESEQRELVYGVLSDYQVPVRVVADLWFKLLRLRNSIQVQGRAFQHEVFKVAYSLLEDGVLSDNNLSDKAQQFVLRSFESRVSPKPSWRISPKQTKVSWEGGVADITATDSAFIPQVSCVTSFDGRWRVQPNLPAPDGEFELDSSARAMFFLTHDLIHLMQRDYEEPSCVNKAEIAQLAATIHDFNPLDSNSTSSRIVIEWPKPDFATFMDWNHFLEIWKDAICRVDEVRDVSSDSATTRITRLAYWWVVTTVAIYDGQGFDLTRNEAERDLPGDWLKLGMRVERLATQVTDVARNDLGVKATVRFLYPRVRNWLERLPLLLVPESKVSREVVQQFFNGVVEQKREARSNGERSAITDEERLAVWPNTALYKFWAADGRSRRIRKQRAAWVTNYRKIVPQSHTTQAFNEPAQRHESEIVKLVQLIDSPTDGEQALAEATEALRAFVELCGPRNAGFVPGSGREMTAQRSGWINEFQIVRDTPVLLTINEIERLTGHLLNHYWALEGRATKSNHGLLNELLTKAMNALEVAKHAESGHRRQTMNPFERGGVLCPTAQDEEGRPKGTGTGTNP